MPVPMNRDGYVSTLCRIGDHTGCQERPVVKCDCECHIRAAGAVGPVGEGTAGPAAPVGSVRPGRSGRRL